MAQVPERDSWLLLAGMIQVNLVDVDVRSNTTSSISSTNKKIISLPLSCDDE